MEKASVLEPNIYAKEIIGGEKGLEGPWGDKWLKEVNRPQDLTLEALILNKR
jgi:hypothetical protein